MGYQPANGNTALGIRRLPNCTYRFSISKRAHIHRSGSIDKPVVFRQYTPHQRRSTVSGPLIRRSESRDDPHILPTRKTSKHVSRCQPSGPGARPCDVRDHARPGAGHLGADHHPTTSPGQQQRQHNGATCSVPLGEPFPTADSQRSVGFRFKAFDVYCEHTEARDGPSEARRRNGDGIRSFH